jgi:glycosyltransferase involved in cell wall biosynthesis
LRARSLSSIGPWVRRMDTKTRLKNAGPDLTRPPNQSGSNGALTDFRERADRRSGPIKTLFLSDHLAPYNIPTLTAVHRRGVLELHALLLMGKIGKHSYWPDLVCEFPHEALWPDRAKESFFDLNLELLSKLSAGKYDVVVVSGYLSLSYMTTIMYCLVTSTPFVWCIDSVLQTPRPWIRRAPKALPLRFIIGAMGAAWVPGRASVEYLKAYGASERRVFQGCYCLDTEKLLRLTIDCEKNRAAARAKLGYAAGQRVFLFVGRMIPERGLPYLIEAWDLVSRRQPGIRLILIGTGPERAKIESMVAHLRLSGVEILDPVPTEQLVPYFVISDVYVHPSVSETYSLTTAHAALSGKPVIVSDQVGALDDYVLEGETGFVVRAGDPSSLAHAIESAARCAPEVLTGMGRKARELAVPRTPEWAASQLEDAVSLSVSATKAL